MGTKRGLAVVILSVAMTPALAAAATLFVDEFDLDPSLNGWTESIDQGSDTTNAADILATGSGEVRFKTDYDGVAGADYEIFRISRTINATGFNNLMVELQVRENTTVESNDNVKIQIDTGSGWVDVAGIAGEFGTTTIASLLGPATDNTTFQLSVASYNNAEDIFLDRIAVFESATSVLYSDGFSLAPESAGSTDRQGFTTGWIKGEGLADNGATVTASGGEAVMARTSTDTSPDADDFVNITHGFSTVGFEDITIQLDARQNNTTFENTDYLDVLYTVDGVNFTSLVKDMGIFNGNANSDAEGAGNTAGATIIVAIADPLAANNPNFALRIEGGFNASSEQYLLNFVQVSGTAISEIPTPSALSAGVLLLAGLLGRRR